MKIRFCAALLLAALSLTLFTGCAAPAEPLDAIEEKVEYRLDAAEEVIIDTLVPAAPVPTAPASEPATSPTEAKLISKEDAIAIALKDAGFTADQVNQQRTGFDRDGRNTEYEVDFRQGGYEYDYEIHAETGEILSKDIDREE